MKKILWLIVISTLIYSCGYNKEIKKVNIKRELEKNGIFDLKYLLEYVDENRSYNQCIQTECFNHRFQYLRIIPLKDSSTVFVRDICLDMYDENDFLLLFKNDSIKIYKPLKRTFETELKQACIFVLDSYNKAIENGNESFNIQEDFGFDDVFSYYKKHYSKLYEHKSLWESRNQRYFIYNEYFGIMNLYQGFCYVKTIKNNILTPFPKFCSDPNPCCPTRPYSEP
jgi:hypothetical protein